MSISFVSVILASWLSGADFTIAPLIKWEFGSTLYYFKVPVGMEETGYNNQTLNFLAKSELAFPLHVLNLGGMVTGAFPGARLPDRKIFPNHWVK